MNNLLRLIGRRLIALPIMALGVTLLVFFLMSFTDPSIPARTVLGEGASPEAVEEYMDELVYRGGPPMRASREAKANTMRIRFEAFMESGSGAGEEGEHPGEGGAR